MGVPLATSVGDAVVCDGEALGKTVGVALGTVLGTTVGKPLDSAVGDADGSVSPGVSPAGLPVADVGKAVDTVGAPVVEEGGDVGDSEGMLLVASLGLALIRVGALELSTGLRDGFDVVGLLVGRTRRVVGSVSVPASDGALLGSSVPPEGDDNESDVLTTVGSGVGARVRWSLGACVGEGVGFAVGVTTGQSVGAGVAGRA